VVPYKKHRRVIADQIPIAFLGIEPDGKAPDIPLFVGGTHFADQRGKAHQQRRGGAWLQGSRFGEFRNICSDAQGAMSSPPFGMNGPFRDSLTVLMRKFPINW
jgi:hypothetical protein